MRAVAALATLALIILPGSALAADAPAPVVYEAAPSAPTLSLVGTISPTWTDNALFSRNDRRSDFYWEPDVSLRLDGKFAPDLAWRVYARTAIDHFAEVHDADEAFALIGGRLTKSVDDWRFNLIYENRYVYAGVFQDLAFVAHDVQTSVGRNFDLGNVTLSPLIAGIYRFADLEEARRFRLDVVLGIEMRLDSRWSIVSTPFVEGYWFTHGLNAGRRDLIVSGSIGLKYNITEYISVTGNVAYEARRSNVPLRHYSSWDIGPRLSFAF